MRPKYDILWKGMKEEVIEDLLHFVEPGIGKDLDLDRGFVFLDKELAELYPGPDQPAKTRVVDQLVKTFLRDGKAFFDIIPSRPRRGRPDPSRICITQVTTPG
jgi:hypothetical protein